MTSWLDSASFYAPEWAAAVVDTVWRSRSCWRFPLPLAASTDASRVADVSVAPCDEAAPIPASSLLIAVVVKAIDSAWFVATIAITDAAVALFAHLLLHDLYIGYSEQ